MRATLWLRRQLRHARLRVCALPDQGPGQGLAVLFRGEPAQGTPHELSGLQWNRVPEGHPALLAESRRRVTGSAADAQPTG